MVSTVSLLGLLAAVPATTLAAAVAARADEFDPSSLTYREVGARNTIDWRIWLEKDGDPISFWHDIPLYPNPDDTSIINFYTEIPRWTDGKVETKRDEPLNPIFHDEKDDEPRFVYSVWPHRSYPFNYGSIPQTWEDPNLDHPFTGFPGDNDPVDIFEIGSAKPSFVGEVKKVKILGGLAMIDEETTDWKIVAIDVEDPLAGAVDTIEDIDQYFPDLRQSFYDWFIYYKVIKGDGTNTITGSAYQNATFAQQIIEESHGYWTNLVNGKSDPNEITVDQTSNPDYDGYIPSDEATEEFDIPKNSDILPPEEKPAEYDQWYYLDEDFKPVVLPGQ
ncbi:hypothetical protein FQN54_009269 [Arachnomyces sp. PD_36]|nr:hypothetical protein FQN54_009269 [Arachnomyces sp. PD_36]